MDPTLLTDLFRVLDAPQHHYCNLERYYTGTQELSFLAPEAKAALGNRFARMASNIPRLAVTSLAERLRITGFAGADVFADWLRNDMDQRSSVAHREALLFGQSFVTVWADAGGRPQVSIESPKEVAVLADPGSREVTSAIKRWRTNTTTEAVVYQPDVITLLRANTSGAMNAGFEVVGVQDNPLGTVPVVPLRNADLISVYYPNLNGFTDIGHSEVWDLVPLVDALCKLLADLMVTSEFVGQPRRWATGIQLVEKPVIDSDGNPVLDDDGEPVMETVSPIPEGHRLMTAESEQARFGQLDAANLNGYQNAVGVIMQQIMAVSALPAHMVGVTTDNPTSADAIRSAEASLTARAEARQQVFGRAWEQVARLIVAVRDGADPAEVDVQVQWCDPATRSTAQEADAVLKLRASGLLSRTGALRKLGFTEDEIAAEMAAFAAENTSPPNDTTPLPNVPQNGAQGRKLRTR